MRKRIRRFFAALGRVPRKVSPRDASDYLGRGLDRHVRGDRVGAIADYGNAIALSSDPHSRAMTYLIRGKARRDLGDLRGAIADYDQAIILQPGHAGGYLSRGLAHREAGDREHAIADLKMVRELSSDPTWRQQAQEALGQLEAE